MSVCILTLVIRHADLIFSAPHYIVIYCLHTCLYCIYSLYLTVVRFSEIIYVTRTVFFYYLYNYCRSTNNERDIITNVHWYSCIIFRFNQTQIYEKSSKVKFH
jgi:hypothetical protein